MCVCGNVISHLCRRGREMGVVEDSELEVAEDVFEYVNESEYAKIVQQRQEEGFVLDDGEGVWSEWCVV